MYILSQFMTMGLTFCNYNHLLSFLPGIMSETFIANVTEYIGGAYFKLGLVLGVSKTFLERLEINHSKDVWRITFEMLSRWRDTSPHRKNMEAMVKELTTALSRLHLNDAAELVRDGKCVA